MKQSALSVVRAFVASFAFFTLAAFVSAKAEVAPQIIRKPFQEWQTHGNASLFAPAEQSVGVTWDSSKTNSFLYLPIGFTVSRADDFKLAMAFRLSSIAIGTTPGKPFSFQIAAGLVNTANAFDPKYLAGTGVDAVRGARNLIEFNYFPDSGFGATVGAIAASRENQFAYGHNFPLELTAGPAYDLEMSFSAATQTLSTRMWKDGQPFGSAPNAPLKDLTLDNAFAGFTVDAIAISSYSDEGQFPEYAGSILAAGEFTKAELTVYNRPKLELVKSAGSLSVRFETTDDWSYQLEGSADAANWTAASEILRGSGAPLALPLETGLKASQLLRLRAVRP